MSQAASTVTASAELATSGQPIAFTVVAANRLSSSIRPAGHGPASPHRRCANGLLSPGTPRAWCVHG